VYEIRVFHAERKVNGSSFKLTLSGFSTNRSDCTAICGDGIVTLGEECDDGVNDGGYGECDAGCVQGPRCGDGTVQPGEDCDDGNRLDGDGCGSACRRLVVR
jgi:cysteine-rich repeat protein